MRVGLVSTVATPVRPTGAGSVESLVYLLARELIRLGHEVTVFAIEGSTADGEVITTLPGSYGRAGAPTDWHMCEWLNLCRAVEESGRFDVLHSHAYLMGIPLERLARCRMVHTTHVQPYDADALLWCQRRSAVVTAISRTQWAEFPRLRPAAIVPHGLDPGRHAFRSEPEDYLLFLGRFIPGKGPLAAIDAARALRMPLVLAGPENDYYRRHVAPLVDGEQVRFAGPVGGEARDRLYGGARALLYPVQEPEPFGLVMVEAMLSGTPVAALGAGAVREVVDEGVTGSIADGADGLAAAVERCVDLDRAAVRRRAEARFSARRMAQDYAELYGQVVA